MALGCAHFVTRGEYAPGPGEIVASAPPPSRGCVPKPKRGEEALFEIICASTEERIW